MRWVRFRRADDVSYGTFDDDMISEFAGDPFAGAEPTGQSFPLVEVALLTPCVPGKMIGLWNNFHGLAAKLEMPVPPEPLYFLKAPNAYLAPGGVIRRPASHDGPVVFEGELGIVIGRECRAIAEDAAVDHILGYTCVNDITAAKIVTKDQTFPQWTRAKSFDTFGPFGPVIETDIDPMGLSVRTILNGEERQNYPVADMIFPPHELVSLLSHDMTLMPGDLISCGTSLGVGAMKEPENDIVVAIDGIGELVNRFVQ